MRALLAALVVTVVGSCGSEDHGAVLLHLDQRSADLSLPETYGSSATGVGHPSDGQLLFAAASNQGVLSVLVAMPIHDGDSIALSSDERIHFQVGAAEWANQGGTVYIISAEPAVIGLVAVPMVARPGVATGSFVFDGNGTFRCSDRDDTDCTRTNQ